MRIIYIYLELWAQQGIERKLSSDNLAQMGEVGSDEESDLQEEDIVEEESPAEEEALTEQIVLEDKKNI